MTSGKNHSVTEIVFRTKPKLREHERGQRLSIYRMPAYLKYS